MAFSERIDCMNKYTMSTQRAVVPQLLDALNRVTLPGLERTVRRLGCTLAELRGRFQS
jgi:hypothetical protein